MTTILAVGLICVSPADAWTQFRGSGDSVSQATNVPVEWSDTQNISWRADLAGFGQSSPVVCKGKIFVTSVQGELKNQLFVECFDLASGKRDWAQEFKGTQEIKDSGYVSKSAPSPAVDDQRVYALFESGDLVAVKHSGEVAWKRSLVDEFGKIGGAHGLGASVVLANGKPIVLIDHDGPSYLLACDPVTGETVWKTDRGTGVSWSTPTVVDSAGQTLVVVSAHDGVQAYDVTDGREVWTFTGLAGNNVPSVTPCGDSILVGSDKAGSNVAIGLGGSGDVTTTHQKWLAEKVSTTFCSALVDGGRAYYVNRAGALFCVNVMNGELLWSQRLPSSCWASPVAADGRLYFFSKDGSTTVLKTGPQFEKLAENQITLEGGDRVYGVAVVDGRIVIRTYRQVTVVSGRE